MLHYIRQWMNFARFVQREALATRWVIKHGEGVEWYSDLTSHQVENSVWIYSNLEARNVHLAKRLEIWTLLHQKNWADYSTDFCFLSIRESFGDWETQICSEKIGHLLWLLSNRAPKPPVFVSETSHNHHHLLRLKINCGSYNSFLFLKGWNPLNFQDSKTCTRIMIHCQVQLGELHANIFEIQVKLLT